MVDEFRNFFDGLLLPLTLGLFGGAARLCKTGFRTWKQFAGSMVVSAFTGVVVHLTLQEAGLSSSMQAAVVAASGYSGGAVLDGLIEHITLRLRNSNRTQPREWDGVERRKQ